jgi:PIN domain nuclease of toxin-antitoxin system
MIALDASALLAFLFREAGHERVAEAVDDSCLSAVNLCEVLGRFARDGHDPVEVLGRIRETAIEIVAFDSDQAALAAALIPALRPRSLSLGDRACLALAVSRGVSALTADRAWAGLDVGVEVRVIR